MNLLRTRRASAVALVAGLGLAVAACAPSSGGATTESSAPETSTTSQSGPADIAALGDITLKFTHWWGAVEGQWIDAVVASFEKKYPNVHIDTTVQDWGQLNSTLNLQLQDADGPDVATANNGWAGLGTLGKAGLVLNLDSYAEQYEWNTRVPTTIARQDKFTTDFSAIGEGSWFATPVARSQPIGLYYNVAKLTALGIDPPQSLDELETAAAAAKAAGEAAFGYGALDGQTAILLGVQATLADKNKLNDYIYDHPEVRATDVAVQQAAEIVKGWADKGYFPAGYEGLDYQTQVANFVGGQGVFRWEYQGSLGLDAEQQNQFGYLQIPQADGSVVGVGAAPAAMVISAKTKYPEAAAAFLDYLMSPEAGQAAADLGLLPMMSPDVKVPEKSLTFSGESAAVTSLDSDDGYVAYFDWSSPTMLDTIGQGLQEMYAGRMTPEQYVASIDADRDAFLADQG